MINKYIQVTKPGIVCGNLISVIGGFLLASKGKINYELFLYCLIGTSLIIASGCVFNNIIDRDIDKKMQRTKNRALVQGLISLKNSTYYAIILGLSGFNILYFSTNFLSILISIIGFVIYVVIYSLYMKRKSIYGTIVGSLSGAAPPMIGYCAVTHHCDYECIILLIIFSLWQIPHSYSIAIFRLADYQAANIPVLPVIKGVLVAKNHIIFYILAFIIATITLSFSGYVGYKYLIVSLIVNFMWFTTAMLGYNTQNNQIWAQKIFILSIISIISLNLMISVDNKMPLSISFIKSII